MPILKTLSTKFPNISEGLTLIKNMLLPKPGRITRTDFIRAALAALTIYVICVVLSVLILTNPYLMSGFLSLPIVITVSLIDLVVVICFYFVLIRATIYRLHDMNMPNIIAYVVFGLIFTIQAMSLIITLTGIPLYTIVGYVLGANYLAYFSITFLLFNLLLASIPGTKGVNKFGPPPNSD